jgi:hypothetical protein
MTEITESGQVREIVYAADGRRAYERLLTPFDAFDKAISLMSTALTALGRPEGGQIWERHVRAQEGAEDQVPALSKLFGGLS